jgi:hypothetical protein
MPFEALEVKPGLPPMEASWWTRCRKGGLALRAQMGRLRCLVFRDGDAVELQSKAGKPARPLLSGGGRGRWPGLRRSAS